MSGHLRLAVAPDSLPRTDSRISVILADDHEMVRRNLRLLLNQEEGLEVIAEAADLASVLRHVRAHVPHVLVLDLRLPNGSSVATIRALRGQVPRTQIVVLTMDDSPVFAQQALGAGAMGFVLKERADDELPVAIRRAARGEEYVGPRLAARLAGLRAVAEGARLTPRETEVLRLIALGFTSAEIAEQLSLSRRTVETHRARTHTKLGLRTRAQLVSYALGRNLIGNGFGSSSEGLAGNCARSSVPSSPERSSIVPPAR